MSHLTWNDHVMEGEAFSAENFLIGAGGLVPHIQLFNPVGSGIRIRLRTVHTILSVLTSSQVARHDVALPTLGLPVGFIVENLLGGGAAEVAEMRSDQVTPAVGLPFWLVSSPANVPAIYPPQGREWGIDLLEGHGVLVQGASGATMIVNWQWVELPL